MIISRPVRLRKRSVSDKKKLQRKSKHSYENRAVYEIMWKNIVEPDRSQMTIWRTRIACWVPKATNTHSEYVILFCFSTPTVVARTGLSVTSYVQYIAFLVKVIRYASVQFDFEAPGQGVCIFVSLF